jgi:type III secretion protein T
VLQAAHATWYQWFALATTEVALGAFIGFISAIPFWAVDMAGFLIDTMRGSSMASVLNPLLEQQSSLLGILFSQVFGLLFLLSGGFNALVASVYDSYALVPPGAPFGEAARWMPFLTEAWQRMYTLFLRFSMPAVVGMVLVDIALGLINRSAQQLNVFFLAMPIKSAFALLMLIMSAAFAYQPLLDQATTLDTQVSGLLGPHR